MKRKRNNISDLARAAGVSVSTVSRVLNDPNSVKPVTKQRVISAIEELQYFPVLLNAMMEPKHVDSRSVGLVIPNSTGLYYAEIAQRIEDILFEHGYMTQVFNTYFQKEREAAFLKYALKNKPAGLIMLSSFSDEGLREELQHFDIPITLLDRMLINPPDSHSCYNSVLLDNFQAGYLAVSHLIELGHKRIAFIAGPVNSLSGARRLDGYKAALANCFLPVDESLIFRGGYGFNDDNFVGVDALMRLSPMPTAVLLFNDENAIRFLDSCQSHQIAVPKKLSVVGFDDIYLAGLHCVNLTTVRLSRAEIGETAGHIMAQALAASDNESIQEILLQPSMIVRSTTAPPAAE